MAKAYEDVEEDRPGSVTAAVRVEQRIAELCGLDAPKRTVYETVPDGVGELWAKIYRAGPPRFELTAGDDIVDAEMVEG